ncbi:hypothetical protein BRC90_06810 [Halobacteriales archaeon QS_4_69_34]|nr:MAG: hypothetical protein BRC90_06810 [Halobacteriales archaeon QS_4_69_34]
MIGKVRIAERSERNYKDERGDQYIWHRYNREQDRISAGHDEIVSNITLDVWDKNEFDSAEDHFLFLTEDMITGDTYSKGDQKIRILSPGKYEGPLSKYTDDWDAIFNSVGASTKMAKGSSVGPVSEDPKLSITEDEAAASDLDLGELRKQAEQDSQEAALSTRTTTTQYQRSAAVRKYALARADGVCEACEEDAPFVTKAGDPYLEVHHVHRVSDQGADDPDSVLAICPTCHKQVHHGHDGDNYNKILIDKLQTEIEPGS